jgi:hypothetical protein
MLVTNTDNGLVAGGDRFAATRGDAYADASRSACGVSGASERC